jgi:hypothetical protein
VLGRAHPKEIEVGVSHKVWRKYYVFIRKKYNQKSVKLSL